MDLFGVQKTYLDGIFRMDERGAYAWTDKAAAISYALEKTHMLFVSSDDTSGLGGGGSERLLDLLEPSGQFGKTCPHLR